ncbi:MAG: bifunctional folylpolyglutamate synthase/dihydrofolate synthase [Proteobacteria bacterium]|nr:bifunctional folylpolyglutamate synthase/dihydrofolate synthase [Pseudomonadota bacterium]
MTTGLRSETVLERLTRLHPRAIDLSLARIERLLCRLGNPERALPAVAHVAGTNGKGSVIAYLRAALEAAGYRVHAYISPHLVTFHERIRVAGRLIEEEALYRLLVECEEANGGEPITFFEITTAAAFLAFARAPADLTLLEVGLGGRLDATNVVARPAVSVITPVSIDHVGFLGDTIAGIAFEKAGILKPGVAAVIGRQRPESLAVIEARAAELGAPLVRLGREFDARRVSGTGALAFTFRGKGDAFPAPALYGRHQYDNAAVALAALRILGEGPLGRALPRSAVEAGLTGVDWPARLQPLRAGRLAHLLPAGWELWLDGGHNPGAGEVLAEVAAGWADRPLYLVTGMLRTKDAAGFLKPLARRVTALRAVAVPGHADCFAPDEMAALARSLGLAAAPAADVAGALVGIVAAHRQASGGEGPARVLVCGSLYLAGSVLRENG